MYQSQGAYDQAEPLLVQIRETWEKAAGKEHLNYILATENLARLYEKMGDAARAESLTEEIKAAREKLAK
jgi:hypothetical protein